jgi:hypothetical protein
VLDDWVRIARRAAPRTLTAALTPAREDQSPREQMEPWATPPPPREAGALNAHAQLLKAAAEEAGFLAEPVRAGSVVPDGGDAVWLRLIINHRSLLYLDQSLCWSKPDGSLEAHISGSGATTAFRKYETKLALQRAGLSVPRGACFDSADWADALSFAAELEGEVCIKPNDGANGALVEPGLRTAFEVVDAVARVAEAHNQVVVERSVWGEHWRFFYVQPEIVGIKLGRPAQVIGDGSSTLRQLIIAKASERKRRAVPGHMGPLPSGAGLARLLRRQSIDLDDVPASGRIVFLGVCSNGSQGAETVICNDRLHGDYWTLMRRAFQALPGLRYGAADTVIRLPNAPPTPESYEILEINAAPSLLAYHHPWEGPVQDVSRALVRMLDQLCR